MSGFFDGILNAVTGGGSGLAGEIIGAVKDYFPPDMAPEKKAQMELDLQRLAFEREKAVDAAIAESEKAVNDRIAQYEGTASDLKAVPIIGPLMLFARGAQRPVWGFACLYMDYEVFSAKWALAPGSQSAAAFYIINVLVLGFLFGERAVKNVAPFITDMLAAKAK